MGNVAGIADESDHFPEHRIHARPSRAAILQYRVEVFNIANPGEFPAQFWGSSWGL